MLGATMLKRSQRVALSTILDPARTGIDLGDTLLAEVPLLGTVQAASQPLDVPEVIGSYRIVRKLAEGGRGAVYEATHVGLETTWAVKVLKPEASQNALFVAEIQHEARVTAKLKQAGVDGIVWVPHVGQMEDGRWYMVVEFLTGRTLQSEIFEGADRWARAHRMAVSQDAEYPPEAYELPVDRSVSIARQVAEIMEMTHRQGVIHRDLKPANVFLVHSGEKGELVRVVDFGLAVNLRSTSADWVPAGTPVGSPPYMPPEQVRGEAVSPASDVYALGAMLYELLAGRWPHEGHEDMRRAKLEVAPPLVSEFRRGVPSGIVTLLRDALALDPQQRPQSMAEFSDRLRAATRVRVTGTVTGSHPARSGSFLGTLLGVVVVAMVIAMGFVGWRFVDPASHAEFMRGARQAARVVRETSRPVIGWLKEIELPEFLRAEEPAPRPTSGPKVEPQSKQEPPPVRKPVKRRRVQVRSVTVTPDASTGAPPGATKP